MKKLIFLFLLTFVVLGNFKVSAQENDRIYISVYQPDKDEITSEASKHLTNKMKISFWLMVSLMKMIIIDLLLHQRY